MAKLVWLKRKNIENLVVFIGSYEIQGVDDGEGKKQTQQRGSWGGKKAQQR